MTNKYHSNDVQMTFKEDAKNDQMTCTRASARLIKKISKKIVFVDVFSFV